MVNHRSPLFNRSRVGESERLVTLGGLCQVLTRSGPTADQELKSAPDPKL